MGSEMCIRDRSALGLRALHARREIGKALEHGLHLSAQLPAEAPEEVRQAALFLIKLGVFCVQARYAKYRFQTIRTDNLRLLVRLIFKRYINHLSIPLRRYKDTYRR